MSRKRHITVRNPWSGELVEVPFSRVSKGKLGIMAQCMDDVIREEIHYRLEGPCSPGRFFAMYADIVGCDKAGILWFS